MMTNDIQRLVELLEESGIYAFQTIENNCCEEKLKLLDKANELRADYLLSNGVVVPPCKVGDIIWVKDFKRCCVIEETEITEIVQNKYGTYIRYEYPALRGRIYARSIEYIGKTVYLSREEAEQALVTDKNVGGKEEEGVPG